MREISECANSEIFYLQGFIVPTRLPRPHLVVKYYIPK